MNEKWFDLILILFREGKKFVQRSYIQFVFIFALAVSSKWLFLIGASD